MKSIDSSKSFIKQLEELI